MYAKLAFSNEIAGALALHPKAKWLYAHHPENVKEEVLKTAIDVVALVSIGMLAVKSFKKHNDEKDALATAVGTLIVAFVVPNLFLGKAVKAVCRDRCNGVVKVCLALVFVFGLYLIEHPVVHSVRKLLGEKKEDKE